MSIIKNPLGKGKLPKKEKSLEAINHVMSGGEFKDPTLSEPTKPAKPKEPPSVKTSPKIRPIYAQATFETSEELKEFRDLRSMVFNWGIDSPSNKLLLKAAILCGAIQDNPNRFLEKYNELLENDGRRKAGND